MSGARTSERPAWWTADDDAARNAAARGCPKPGEVCAYCRAACPLERRNCRTCAEFASADGVAGRCGASGRNVNRFNFCNQWRARP